MRILVTGCTFLQVNPTRRVISKIDVPQSIVETLSDLGHEVDWRKVEVGEDLSHYDAALVCLAPITSTNARKGSLGALWTLSQKRNLPTAALFDDWQFSAVFNGMRALKRNGEYLNKIIWGERFFPDDELLVNTHKDELVATAVDMLGPAWNRILPVCPMYRWGDREKVIAKMPEEITEVFALDPSPTIYDSVGGVHAELESAFSLNPQVRERAWLLAALMPHQDWLLKKETEWPVHIIGSRKLHAERLKTEEDVIARYFSHWGILSPPYNHAGGGWWRSRFIYAASSTSVLVCDKGEGLPIGPSYGVTIAEVEAMSNTELTVLALQQQTELRPWLTTWTEWQSDVQSIFIKAMDKLTAHV
jgi:hypothetical protein